MNKLFLTLFFFIVLTLDFILSDETNETIPEEDKEFYEPRFKLPPDTGKY